MYELSNEDFKVNYMPDTIIEEILQNGRTILGTFSEFNSSFQYSVIQINTFI